MLVVTYTGSLGVAALTMLLRLARRQSLLYSLGGLAAVALATLLVWLSGRAASYFLPGIVNGGLSLLIALVSVLVKRPLMAWTSHIARRWPLRWYWHPRVRPAYSETTWLWILYFAARLYLQTTLLQAGSTGTLALVQLLTSWPATIVLLMLTYLYGTWRLRHLGGPGVQELREGTPPPWQGQRRGC